MKPGGEWEEGRKGEGKEAAESEREGGRWSGRREMKRRGQYEELQGER